MSRSKAKEAAKPAPAIVAPTKAPAAEKKDTKSKQPKGKSKSVPKVVRKRDVKAAKVEAKKIDKVT